MARNDANQQSPPPSSPRAKVGSVVLRGVDGRPPCEVTSSLKRAYPILKRGGELSLTVMEHNGSTRVSHPAAKTLLSMSHNPCLFGEESKFEVLPYVQPDYRLFVPWIPKHVNNGMLKRLIPGLYKVERFRGMPRKAIIFLNDELNQALLLRDGIMIGKCPITFETVLRRKCRSCNSLEHGSCDNYCCYNCGVEGHTRDECTAERSCLWCHSDSHELSECAEYQQERISHQEWEQRKLLELLKLTNMEAESGEQPDEIALTVKQKKFLEKNNISDCFTSPASYAAIVSKRTRKNRKRSNRRRRPTKTKNREASIRVTGNTRKQDRQQTMDNVVESTIKLVLPTVIEAVFKAVRACLTPILPKEGLADIDTIDLKEIEDEVINSMSSETQQQNETKLDDNDIMDIQVETKRKTSSQLTQMIITSDELST